MARKDKMDKKLEKMEKKGVSEEQLKQNGILYFTAENDLFPMLKEMGNSTKSIEKYQRDRLVQALLVFIGMLIIAYFVGKLFLIIAVVLPIVIYRQKYSKVKNMHRVWRFERHLQFTKFTRLLIPYLKAGEGDVSLYQIFNKILQRTEKMEDRNSLYQLMTEMTDKPYQVQPFIDFAERSSGTDMSILFMSTVFDFQQNTRDSTVIDELGKISSQELMEGIDEIIEFKLRRFVYFPTKVVMTSFILVVGYAAAVLWHNISQVDLF